MENVEVIDLFCGIGGLSYGFKNQNFKVVAGFDSDTSCKDAFEKNIGANTFHSKDIMALTAADIQCLYSTNTTKILVGCAPCQPFSNYTASSSGTKGKNDHSKWSLLNYFGDLVAQTQPTIVSMENVPQLFTKDRYSVFQQFNELLCSNGYTINSHIVYCPDYGIPQQRKRLVLLASKLGDISLIPPTHTASGYKTVRQTIGHLPSLKAGAQSEYNTIHKAQALSPTNIKRIQSIKEGQSWRNMPEELINPCHKKKGGSSYGDVYGRMKWDSPAPTMTTHCIGFGNGRFGHPEQDRGISLLEAALIQTFPESYFEGINYTSTNLQRHIGNAVPVKLGEVIAQSIKLHLQEYNIH